MNYRVYLMQAGHIRAAESFSADDDADASETAALLYKSCSDVFECCELWRSNKRIASLTALSEDGLRPIGLEDAVRARQENLLELEDHLERTFSAIRTSRKLLNASARLRDRLKVTHSDALMPPADETPARQW